jgi:hypothetical protein
MLGHDQASFRIGGMDGITRVGGSGTPDGSSYTQWVVPDGEG